LGLRKSESLMLQLTAGEIESAIRGHIEYGSRATVVSGISIDTRSLKPGDLFFAIRGPNQDGHRFIPEALSKGAAGAVAENGFAYPAVFPPGRLLLKAADTHQALKDLAAFYRRRWSGTLVAITGSMGKTTTKEFAAQILERKLCVYRTPGNYNNLFGLPLALFGLESAHDLGIFEMGMSAPGEIAEMCRIAAPSIGIITNIAPVHLEFFSSLEEIARAKGELVDALPLDGLLIHNTDDPLVEALADRFPGVKCSFGFTERAQVRAEHFEIRSLQESRFRLSCAGAVFNCIVPFAGKHNIMNTLPGIALGMKLRVEPEHMVQCLPRLRQPSMRGGILNFRQGFTVIDDSYNSNPRALMQMIEVLATVPCYDRRILLAGEMLELGKESPSLHCECGRFAAGHKIDLVIGVQGMAREIVRGAVESGLDDSRALFFATPEAALNFVADFLRARDLVLIKGSRGVHMEKIVQGLCARFGVASNGL